MVGGHRNPAGSTTNAAVFTRSHRPTFSDPAADSVIGKAARLAVTTSPAAGDPGSAGGPPCRIGHRVGVCHRAIAG
jgi:hypothetical protein